MTAMCEARRRVSDAVAQSEAGILSDAAFLDLLVVVLVVAGRVSRGALGASVPMVQGFDGGRMASGTDGRWSKEVR